MKKISIALIAIMIIVISSACLVGCDKAKDIVDKVIPEEIGIVDVNTIVYDNSKLTWGSVKGAQEYIIKFEGDENEKISKTNELTQLIKKDFTVTITAKGKKEVGESVSKTFHKLGDVEGLAISETGELSWSLVDGADAYKILLNNKELEDTISTTTFSEFVEGKNTIKVKPINSQDSAYFGSWSEMQTITIVPNPTEIKYDGQYISWKGNNLAKSYEVYINGTIYETVNDATRLLYDAEQTSFDIKVRSIGDHKSTYDAKIPETDVDILFLKPVSEFFVSNGAISWTGIEDAVGYQIEINGTVQPEAITDTAYSNIPEGKRIAIRVKPVSNVENTFTDWSAVQEVFLLSKPKAQWNEALALDGEKANSLFWDAVPGAAGYTVEVTYPNKTVEEKILSKDDKSFAHDYLNVGEYKLRIKANAEANTSTYDSSYSQPVTVVRLGAPKAATQGFIKSDKKDLASGVTVTFEKVSGASQYRVYKDNVEIQGNNSISSVIKLTDIVPKNTTKEQQVNYAIQSVGGFENSNHGITVTLDSLSANNLSFKLTVLGKPSEMRMDGYNYNWTGSANGDEYGVNVGGNVRIVSTTNVDLSYIEAGQHDVSICSAGNGSDVLASYYTAPLSVKRLEAPSNIKIHTTDKEEGRLDWNDVDKAKSYSIIIGKDAQPIEINKLSNINSKITEKGTVISMRAVANYYNSDDPAKQTEYYMTSIDSETVQFIKLANVEFTKPYIRGNSLVWNAPYNVDTKVYTPTYRVYDGGNISYNGLENSTSFDFTGIKAGTYTFSVKAVGDGVHFINSGLSNSVKIRKLAMPEVKANGSVYEWKGVPGAVSYKAIVNGVEQKDIKHDTASQTYSFAPHFTEIKDNNKVVVIAVGDGQESVDSDPSVIMQKTKQLNKPTYEYKYSKDAFDKEGNIVVTVTSNDENASGYIYKIGFDAKVEDTNATEKIFNYCPKTAGVYKIGVKAIGQKFGEIDGVSYYFLDSEVAGNNESSKITIFDAPSNVEINRDDEIYFDSITGALGYEIMLLWDGATTGEVVKVKAEYHFERANHTTLKFKIRAIGNGNNTITSEWFTSKEFIF